MQLYEKNKIIKKIVITSIIAALYVVLTLISSIFGLSYSGIQFRLSEALTILPVFSPYAITGLTLGCFISNLSSPFGAVDIIFGTLATFISANITRGLAYIKFKGIPILAPLPPVIVSSVFIGIILAFFLPQGFSFSVFSFSAISIAVSQTVVCYGLGIPLFLLIKRLKIFENLKF